VIHDGPDFEGVGNLVAQYDGRFIERSRSFSQEPHLPFAFGQAHYDWILRFDADEYPSAALRNWLIDFRQHENVDTTTGFYCIWPVWNGRKAITQHWPNKRLFLFNRQRVSYIGVCEQGPLPESRCEKLPLVLRHEPPGASHGFENLFRKKRTRQARENAAVALLGSPLAQPCWRYSKENWPPLWEEVKQHPFLVCLKRLLIWPWRHAIAMTLAGDLPRPSVFLHAGIFNAWLCFDFWRLRRKQSRHA
jgi:hypothetical protein